LNVEEPDFQKLQLDLSEPPATSSETFIQQKIEEQEKSRDDDDELRLKQFEKQLQERIDLQDAEYAVASADQIESDQIELEKQQRLEEEAILAEQRRLNDQRVAQQQLLEQRRKEQLEKLNSQIQLRIEDTLKRDLAEKLEKEKETTSSDNEDEEDGRRSSKDSLPPMLLKRRKVRRRRPKPSETGEALEEPSPFTKFGNGQSRFGFGG